MKAGKIKVIGLVLGLMVFGGGVLETRAQIPADVAIMQNLRDNHGFGAAFGWSTTTNPCTANQNWAGVSCRQQRVSSISIGCGSTPLPAPFPGTEIAGLTALDNLELRECYMNHQPASNLAALDTMTQLVKIRLDSNPGITGNLSDVFPQGLNPTRFPALNVIHVQQTPLGGQIPAGLTQFGNAPSFYLFQARFSGTLPATGNPSMFELWINGNALEGVLPDYIRNASGSVKLGYNKFDVVNTPPGAIDTIDPGWRDTQTVPPTNVQIAQTGAGTATLAWTPIAYTAHGGYYEVLSSQTPGGAYVSRGTTADSGGKTATGLTVSGLPAGTNYFVVRTFTPAHTRETASCPANSGGSINYSTTVINTCAGGQFVFAPNNPNDLTSVNSAETSANIPSPLTVTKTADTNDGVCDADCSLREAIAAANGTSANDQIIFAISPTDPNCPNGVCTITLGSGQLTINSAATAGTLWIFNATGAANLRVSGNNQSRVFDVASGANLTLNGLTVTGGRRSNAGGGGIFNAGILNVVNSAVSGNSVNDGSSGGGIFSSGSLTLTNSTVSGNSASFGGGIWISGTATVTNSTISGNSATGGEGGGILSYGTTTVTNSTVSGNSASFGGGVNSHISGSVNLLNTIVAGNSASNSPDFFGTLNSLGNNLIGNTQFTTITGNTANNILNQPAQLAPLGFYGGTTQTHALTANSPAVGAGSNSEIQTVTPPASGTFRLVFNGHFADLAFDASPAAVQAALVGNSLTRGTGAGNISVSKPGASYIIAFQGALADTNLPPITDTNATVQTLVDGNTTPVSDQRGASRVSTLDIGAFELNNSTNGGIFVADLPNGTQNVGYNYTLVPNNGAFTYSITGGALPNGVNLTTNVAPNAIVALAGTPMQTGVFDFQITASDGTNTNVTNYRLNIFAPTAAGVSIGGRVSASDGRGVRNAIVVITLSNGETIQTRTGTFGYYRFDDIEVGQTAVVSVVSKRFTFAPQIVNISEDIAELNFTVQQFGE